MTASASHAGPARHARNFRRRNTGQPDPKLVLLLTCGAVFVSVLDLTVVNVAFPDLRADFPSASLPTLSWVVTAYGVMFAALLSAAGRLADVVGRQRLFGWSVAAFTATSMLAAAATNEGALIYFRALQGASAAGMSPAALGLILAWTPPERLMPAIGVSGATASVASAVGPSLGGVLVDAWGWRVIFLINVPLGLAVVYATMTRLSRDTPSARRLPDPIGTVLFTAGIGAVVVSLSQGSQWGWTSRPVLLALAGGLLAVGAGLERSARHPVPAIELDLWRNRTFTVANAASVLFGASAFAMVLNGPLFLTSTWHYSVFETGLALTPSAFASGIGSVVAGKLAATPRAKRAAAVGGSLLLATAGFYLWARLGTRHRFVDVYLPGSLMTGLGFGLAITALFGAGATSVPPSRFASGSGLLTMSRQLGGVLGVAAAAAILAAGGYSAPVDAFLAVYLFCGVLALTAASASLGLPRLSPASLGARAAAGDTVGTAGTVAAAAAGTVDGGKRAGAGKRVAGGLAPAAGRVARPSGAARRTPCGDVVVWWPWRVLSRWPVSGRSWLRRVPMSIPGAKRRPRRPRSRHRAPHRTAHRTARRARSQPAGVSR